jgi:hypothetical protein
LPFSQLIDISWKAQPEPATFDVGGKKGANMTINLPKPIAAYFAADSRDGHAIAECFTGQAVVKDEGRTYIGHAAIRKWKAESSAKYNYTSEPIAVEDQNSKTIVTSHLVGDFPGSPVDLRYFFVLEGDKIGSLEIVA